jgi:rhodanese-related sulfurtransferase
MIIAGTTPEIMTSTRVFGIAAGLVFLVAATSGYSLAWSLVNAKIRRDFPEVKRISTAELAAWLADDNRPAPLLLDVRTQPEYEVSHLRDAEWIAPDAPPSAVEAPKDRPIVTYCSVGYRSGAFAEKLHEAGFTNVVNLEGSIFAWANEGRPLVHDGAPAEKVHPYNGIWGLLLRKEHRADVPIEEAKP